MDRRTLHIGRASARLYRYAEVKQAFEVDLLVCGGNVARCLLYQTPGPQAAGDRLPGEPSGPAPRGEPSPLGEVVTGGRVLAQLTAADPSVTISGGEPATQTIIAPDDIGEWRWSVRAAKAGSYTFTIKVAPLRAETNEGLYPPKYFDFPIEVRDTLGSRATNAARGANWILTAGGAGLGTLISAAIAILVYRRSRRSEASAPAPTGVPVPAAAAAPNNGDHPGRPDLWTPGSGTERAWQEVFRRPPRAGS